VAGVMSRLGLSEREWSFESNDDIAPDIYSAALEVRTRSGKQLGVVAVVSPALLKKFDIKQEVFFAELDWDAITRLAVKRKVTAGTLPKTQPVRRDLALLIDSAISFAQVEAVVRESERRLLRSVKLFDVYEGKNLPAGKKSYAIAMTLQDDEKTLQDKQIDATMTKIINNLKQRLGAELR
jgi:phenylalanyl-tRNA synthetase beta chain